TLLYFLKFNKNNKFYLFQGPDKSAWITTSDAACHYGHPLSEVFIKCWLNTAQQYSKKRPASVMPCWHARLSPVGENENDKSFVFSGGCHDFRDREPRHAGICQ
ncbi:MAG: hypothetical protein ACC634_10000, partial [Hyphomicrobiales bacterium]